MTVRAERTAMELDEAQSRCKLIIVSTEHLRQLSDGLQKYQDKIASMLESFAQAQEAFRVAMQPTAAALKRIGDAFLPFSRLIHSSVFVQIAEDLRCLPARMEDALLMIAKEGWYIDAEMPLSDIWHIRNMISSGDKLSVERKKIIILAVLMI